MAPAVTRLARSMVLILTADALDEIPEGLRNDAKQEGAKFVANLKQGWAVEDVSKLRQALQAERNGRSDAEKKLKAFEGIEDAEAAREALEKVKTGGLRSAKEIEEWKREATERHAKEIAAAKTAAEQARLEARTVKFERDIHKALTKHKGDPKYLLPVIERMARWEKNGDGNEHLVFVGDDGRVRVSQKSVTAEPMDADELVEVLKPEYPAAFLVPGTGGSGANHSAGGSARGGQSVTSLSPDELWARA